MTGRWAGALLAAALCAAPSGAEIAGSGAEPWLAPAMSADPGELSAAAGGVPAPAGADVLMLYQDVEHSFDGDSRATMKLGVVTRFTRSLLSVYEPEHPDMVDNGKERTALDSKDQESVQFEIGKGVVKKGRFGGAATSQTLLDVSELSLDEKKDIQRALNALGHYRSAIDGLFGGGYRRAVNAFQASINEQQTGALTVFQTSELSRKSGMSLGMQTGSTGSTNSPSAVSTNSMPHTISAIWAEVRIGSPTARTCDWLADAMLAAVAALSSSILIGR